MNKKFYVSAILLLILPLMLCFSSCSSDDDNLTTAGKTDMKPTIRGIWECTDYYDQFIIRLENNGIYGDVTANYRHVNFWGTYVLSDNKLIVRTMEYTGDESILPIYKGDAYQLTFNSDYLELYMDDNINYLFQRVKDTGYVGEDDIAIPSTDPIIGDWALYDESTMNMLYYTFKDGVFNCAVYDINDKASGQHLGTYTKSGNTYTIEYYTRDSILGYQKLVVMTASVDGDVLSMKDNVGEIKLYRQF